MAISQQLILQSITTNAILSGNTHSNSGNAHSLFEDLWATHPVIAVVIAAGVFSMFLFSAYNLLKSIMD